jgi:hypothetical protein
MEKNYEEEYSLLEIAKYNLKHWPVLLICALVVGLIAGGYGYMHTEPSVVYYQELMQVNSDYFISDYNDSSITERMYDLEQVAYSHGAYETFMANTGYDLTFEEYQHMFGYGNLIVTSVINIYMGYPMTVGTIDVETDAEAVALMQQLVDTHEQMYAEFMGDGAITQVGAPYTSTYTQAAADAATTPKDLLIATARGGIAGIFLGLLLAIVVTSAIYLIGTVAKTAKEIEQKLKCPAIAFVHKDDRDEEFKKVYMFLESLKGEKKTVCYAPFNEKHTDGAYDLAKMYAKMNYKTLEINLSAQGAGNSLSTYLTGGCDMSAVTVQTTDDGVDVVTRNTAAEGGRELLSLHSLYSYIEEASDKYERVIVNAPDLKSFSDAYGIALHCDRIVVGCRRREVTGTDLYEINNTMENSGLAIDGVVIYGN